MAPNDAEMPAAQGLGDDLHQISERMASLRQDLESLTGDVRRLGSHQLDHLQNTASAAAAEVAGAVRRNPLAAIAIAAGAGFLYGILTRR
jgi:ElaB/YqjD/DUF883 family membrane-anchored ribosome-binding protein